MMIEKHISALLYRYQCVTVPGFGAFLTEIQPAQLNDDTHTFYPPKKLISFNANLKNNDGLLANHIALQEKISYEQAVANIDREIESWIDKLQNRQTIALKNLGEMAYNFEGSLVFSPNTPINYFTDAFGLSAITSPAVKREEFKVQAEALEEIAPIVFTPERKKNYSYLKYAAMFAVMVSVGGAGFKVYRDNEIDKQTLLVEQSVQEKVNDKIQQATFFIENPLPAVKLSLKEDKSTFPYHVVAGAFRSKTNAAKAKNELIAKGYKARSLEKNKFGLYPVLYGSFPTYAEAHENMKKIHKTQDKEAWLLIKEL
ncbi:Sporulation related domain protein [compost metagenome]